MIHVFQIHKETIETVPGAKEGRDSFDNEIFGMEGVPPEMIEEKRIQMFGEPAAKKLKLEQNVVHPLLSGVPGDELIIPGTSSTTQNSSRGTLHPSRQMMLASAPATTMPMFGMGMGFPGTPLPLWLPPPPPPKPWPPKQPQLPQAPSVAQLPQQPPPPKMKPIITTPPGQLGAIRKPAVSMATPVSAPIPPVANLPPPPITMTAVLPPVPTPSAPVPNASFPVGLPAPPQHMVKVEPSSETVAVTVGAATSPTVVSPPPITEPKESTPPPISPVKKKKKNTVLIYEEKYISQEEMRAMNPKYSAHLNRRIASLSSSIEERLRSLK